LIGFAAKVINSRSTGTLSCGARLGWELRDCHNEYMSFHTHARLVRRGDLPLHRRRAAFCSCIQCYCWLINEKFSATYLRYYKHFGLDFDKLEVSERLNQAMDGLEAERHLFLERLRLFDKRRIKEKIQGRRSPSKASVAALYGDTKFIVPKPEE
jgi:hypothetical protein